MSGPGGEFDATLSALESCAEQVGRVQPGLDTFSGAFSAAVTAASEAAGEGPLAEALEALREGAASRCRELGEETAQLAKALRTSAADYRDSDAQAGGQLARVSFGGVTG